jgi:hypothetical protein
MRGLLCFEAPLRRHLCGDADVNNTTTAGQVAIMSPAGACEGEQSEGGMREGVRPAGGAWMPVSEVNRRQIPSSAFRPGARVFCYSALIPAALMIGHHFSISAFCCAASPSGVCLSRGQGSCPSSMKR